MSPLLSSTHALALLGTELCRLMKGRDEPSVVDLPNTVLKGPEGEVSDPKVAVPIFRGIVNVSIDVASAYGGGPNDVASIVGGRPDDNTREFPTPFPFSLEISSLFFAQRCSTCWLTSLCF